MIRAVLAVACAIALVGASVPAIDDARTERTAASLETELDRLDRAAVAAADAERSRTGAPGARRVATIDLPASGRFHAGVDQITVGEKPAHAVTYQIEDGYRQTVPLSVPVSTADGTPIECSGGSRLRLVVRPATDGDGVVLSADSSCIRGFK